MFYCKFYVHQIPLFYFSEWQMYILSSILIEICLNSVYLLVHILQCSFIANEIYQSVHDV